MHARLRYGERGGCAPCLKCWAKCLMAFVHANNREGLDNENDFSNFQKSRGNGSTKKAWGSPMGHTLSLLAHSYKKFRAVLEISPNHLGLTPFSRCRTPLVPEHADTKQRKKSHTPFPNSRSELTYRPCKITYRPRSSLYRPYKLAFLVPQ
jgi:hypothetical protein